MLKGGLKKIASYPRFTILVVIATFIIFWAAWTTGPLEKFPTQSFFRLTKTIKIKICEGKKRKKKKSNICIESSFVMTASGFVVANGESEGSYILTAAHVCESLDDLKNIKIDPLQKIFKKPKVSLVSEEFKGIDIRGAEHTLKIVHTTDTDTDDLCLMYGDSIEEEPLPIADTAAPNGEKVYNMSAPTGYSFKNMVPIFEGYYSGLNPEGWAIFTIPVIGGSSGSPILDKRGEVVGMIVMRLVRFHHVALSPQRAAMATFVKTGLRKHKTPGCLCSKSKEE